MLYHYFTSKDGLFAAVLDDQLSSQPALAPTSLVDRHGDASGRTDWIRLLMWQALAGEIRPTNATRAGASHAIEAPLDRIDNRVSSTRRSSN